jgi:hypothetical protein
MARAGSWKLFKYSQNPGGPRPFSLPVNSVSGSPGVFEPIHVLFFFLASWKLGIMESGNCDHFTGTACMHVSRTRKALATLQGPRRAQRLGQSARRCSARRGRLGIASEHARILAAPADARRIESRAALRRRRHLLSCDGHDMIDMLRSHFRTIGFARRLPSQQAQARYRQWLAL